MRYVVLLLIVCALLALGANIAAAQEDPAGTTDVTATQPAPAAAPDIESDPIGSIQSFIDAVRSGNWKMVGSLALALIMLLLTKVRNKIAWFSGDRGGAVLVMLLGLLGGFSASLAAGTAFDWKLILGVVMTVWTAVGGYQWVKRVIWPKDKATA